MARSPSGSGGAWAKVRPRDVDAPLAGTRDGVGVGARDGPVAWNGFDFFPNPTVVNETNPNLTNPADASMLPGVHYLSNVLDTASPSYPAAVSFVGFDPTDSTASTTSRLCTGADASLILSAGFLPLAAGRPGRRHVRDLPPADAVTTRPAPILGGCSNAW